MHLILGSLRSGKSRYAEQLAFASGLPVRYLATADPAEPGMGERIAAHQARRPPEWETVEVGRSLAPAVAGAEGRCLLFDGVGLYLARLARQERSLAAAGALAQAELSGLLGCGAALLLVVCEAVGEALLPQNRLGREWLEELGRLSQWLAARAATVELVVAGRPLALPAAKGATAAQSPLLRYHGDQAVGSGEQDHAVNVVGPAPQWLARRLQLALAQSHRYPEEGKARAALARRHRRLPSEVLPTNGAVEALWLLACAFRPTVAVVIHPAFSESELALRAFGVAVRRVVVRAEERFALEPQAVPAEAELVVATNPCSPTGRLYRAKEVLALRRPGRLVVVDEAFMEFLPEQRESLAGRREEGVLVVRSLTKLLGLAGLRVGYAVGEERAIRELEAVRPPWAVNTLALTALEAACARPAALAALARKAQRQRLDLERRLEGVAGVTVYPGVANFCLVEVGDGPTVAAALHREGIAVREGWTFPGLDRRFLRLTARSPRQNRRLAEALAEVCGR